MSDGGGDTGGGDSGGAGKGGGPSVGTNSSGSSFAPPADNSGSTALPFETSAGEQAGFQGGGFLPPEISSGSSGGAAGNGNDVSPWSTPSINDFVSGPSDFNLAGSGPVGGNSPIGVATDTFSSNGGNSVPVTSGDTNPLGTTAPNGGGGIGATAFAAPEGVSGTTDLSSITKPPATGTGAVEPDYSLLNNAEQQTTNEWGAANATSVPADGSTSLPATTSGSSGGTSGGAAGSSSSGGGSNGILGTGITTNGLGIAAAGAGLLNNLINGNKSVPAMGQLSDAASTAAGNSKDFISQGQAMGAQYGTPALQSGQQQTATGQALQQYVSTGTLPQGYEDQVQQAAQSAKSQIISNYANRGLPTDPSKNSALAQELSQVDARIPAMREQLASQLATTGNSIVASGNATSNTGNQLTANGLLTDGLTSAGISSGVYQTLANLENSQNQQRGQAIANFASALNGGNKGVTLNLGTSKAA